MKKSAFILCLVVLCAACADPEIKDPMSGAWKVKTLDVRNTKPVIDVAFTLTPAGQTYAVGVESVIINGYVESGFTGISSSKSGELVTITLQSGTKTITIKDFNDVLYTPAATIQNIEYRNDAEAFNYPLQSAYR